MRLYQTRVIEDEAVKLDYAQLLALLAIYDKDRCMYTEYTDYIEFDVELLQNIIDKAGLDDETKQIYQGILSRSEKWGDEFVRLEFN